MFRYNIEILIIFTAMSRTATISNRGLLLFNEMIVVETVAPDMKAIKGRSEELDQQRNECLVTRYIYMMDLTGWRLDLLKRMLAKDFFLKVRTVEDILAANYFLVKQIREQRLTKKNIAEKFPQYCWEMPDKSYYE
jgi:hypothetical protein